MTLWSKRGLCCCLWALQLAVCSSARAQAGVAERGNCSADNAGMVSCSESQAEITGPVASPPSVQVGVFSIGGIGFGLQGEAEIVRHEPYRATAVTGIRQTLANGTNITQTIRATVARDSEGRTVRIQKLQGNGPFFSVFRGPAGISRSTAQAEPPTLTTIFDPVAREHIDYASDAKIARLLPIDIASRGNGEKRVQAFPVSGHAGAGAIAAYPVPGAPGPVTVANGDPIPPPMVMRFGEEGKDEKTESLGKRTIDGIETVGTRKTWTIPAGAIGNDRALVTTEETWYSPKLKLVLLSIRNDPRFGETTYSLENVSRAEPDPSLFQIPTGYKIDKLPPLPPPGPPARSAPR